MAEAGEGLDADDGNVVGSYLKEGHVREGVAAQPDCFGVLLEADLGRQKIGWFRVARPLITSIAIVPFFLTSVPASGHNLALQAVGLGAGVILGLACRLFVSVGPGPAKGAKGTTARPVSRAGFGYSAFSAVVFGARMAFIYGTEHWFSGPLGQFLVTNQLSAVGLSNALIFMAIAMALARFGVSSVLLVRAVHDAWL